MDRVVVVILVGGIACSSSPHPPLAKAGDPALRNCSSPSAIALAVPV